MKTGYRISEIIEYNSDSSGNLHCTFRLKGDDKELVRVISSDFYFDWVIKQKDSYDYIASSYYDEDSSENIGSISENFDFESWKSDNEDDDTIKSFIYENYLLSDMPDLE